MRVPAAERVLSRFCDAHALRRDRGAFRKLSELGEGPGEKAARKGRRQDEKAESLVQQRAMQSLDVPSEEFDCSSIISASVIEKSERQIRTTCIGRSES